jgi:hypothetical protein
MLGATTSIALAEPVKLSDAQMEHVTAGLFDNPTNLTLSIPVSLDIAASSPVVLNLSIVVQTTVINSTAVALAYGVLTGDTGASAMSRVLGGNTLLMAQP